ncbi:MAG: hypothetical protein KZQ96_21415 [Candidatus Thiodiazotropha sp. (ex Lucinoma borealis)]|nr:hypothetical protein [Candidatus Thiodiazotropha sp. (ex Lucinoma borealis)]MCU7869649.1 hypothetical protein [Candidatus Thiodiazotropha sp. (ex Lucinoma borealis)]
MMKSPLYLRSNRYGQYYFRRAVPKHLQNSIGKRKFVRSLYSVNTIMAHKNNSLMTIPLIPKTSRPHG